MGWDRVRGHEALAEGFSRAVRRGRLAHAFLFTGPAGVGKRLFAGELARALLCENFDPAAPLLAACERCDACTLVAAETHPDFFAVGRPEEGNEIPVGVVRELCRNFALKPARGRGKVAILDDADDLNEESANCFLKTLEEPPPRSVFILIGTRVDRQLPTVVSRCQVVRFAPLPEGLILEILRGQGVEDPAQAGRLARLSGGSPGQALALADPALWEFRKVLLEELARPRPDPVGLGKKLLEFVEEAGKETALQRRRALLSLRLLLEFLNDALTLRLGGNPKLAEPGDHRVLRELVNRLDSGPLLGMLDRCLEAEFQLNRYVQLVLVLEGLTDALGEHLLGRGAFYP